MKKERGFTLVEMVVAVAIASLIISFLAEMISQSIRAYNISIENNEAMTKINPVLKRIEGDVVESYGNITEVYPLTSGSKTSFAGIKVEGDFGVHDYFWDGNCNGTLDAAEGSGSPGASSSIYRVSGSAIDVLLSSKGGVPLPLSAKYGDTWKNSYIKINSFYFSFYREEPAGSGKTVVWDSSVATTGTIKYIKIHADIEGAYEQSAFKFDTGLKIK